MVRTRTTGSILATIAVSSCIARSLGSDDSKLFTIYEPGGVQSGPDITGASFASAAIYDPSENAVIITGSTWGRFFESPAQRLDEDFDVYGGKVDDPVVVVEGCFLATATLPGSAMMNQDTNDLPRGLFWSHRQRLRTPSANEACNAIHLFEDTATVLVAGHTEERLNQTIRTNVLQEKTVQSGMLMAEEWLSDDDTMYTNVGGQLLQNSSLVYPTAMTSRSGSPDDGLFVVFMEANQEARHIGLTEGNQPHDPAEYFNYGAGYGFSVGRFDFLNQQVTRQVSETKISQTWLQSFDTTDPKSQVFANDIVKVANGLLVVVGTTNGLGKAFGAETNQGTDLDGFLVKVSPSNGQLIIEPGYSPSYRIQSNNKKHGNDWATAVCSDPIDEQQEQDQHQRHVYIVGTSEGKLSGSNYDEDDVSGTSAYLIKFDVRHMTPVWTKQIGAVTTIRRHETIVRGMACAVTPDGRSVWLGGTVDDGGVIAQSGLKQGFGGKDIFAAVMDTTDGKIQFVKQLGTEKDDELAIRGGLISDSAGNGIVVGNTYGSFYRARAAEETASDVFILTVSIFDGLTLPHVGIHGATVAKERSSSNDGVGVGFVFLALCAVSLVITALLYVRWRSSSKATATTDRSQVTSYLGRYDVEDVELKHSATGGWHCNFVNRLAAGESNPRQRRRSNTDDSGGDVGEVYSSLSLPRRMMIGRSKSRNASTEPDALLRRESSAINEFLLCDNSVDFEDGLDHGKSRSTGSTLHGGTGSAYGDLVDAYNSTWSSGGTPYSDQPTATDLTATWGKEII